jgi:ubiquinone/menaquinone biosynthesis C-methylase UbiE
MMNHQEVGRFWNENAEVWTRLSRQGYDVFRDYFNTPAFFQILPEVRGLRGLDIGCGEGHNTRLLADLGARVTAADVSEIFIHHARQAEAEEPRNIDYRVASAVELPFDDAAFDFATGFMSFMDIPETDRVFSEAHRVIKPGGFLQFSIEHPCFTTPHRRGLRNPDGVMYAVEVGDYFRKIDGDVTEWLFKAAPPELKHGLRHFKTPRFRRTMSEWLNLIVDTGFRIERVEEPRPTDAAVRACPAIQGAQTVAYFLHIRARK